MPRSSAEAPRSGTASLEHSSNEGHAGRKSSKPKGSSDGPKSAPRRAKHSAAQHRAAVPPASSTQPAALGSGQGSFHPVLGLHVPHARRSYHRDTVAKADVAALHAGHAEQQAYGMSAIHQGLVKPRKTTHSRAQKNAGYAAQPQPPLRRVPSDSSMTVSANSNDD